MVTAPQLKEDEPPGEIVEGDAVKEEMFGVPLHPLGGGGTVGVAVRVAVMVGGTTAIVSERWTV